MLRRQDADPLAALAEDNIGADKVVIQRHARPLHRYVLAGAGDEVIVDVIAHAAKAEIAESQTRAGDRLQQVQDLFAVIEAVEQRGETAEIHQEGPQPEQVTGDAVQFAGDHADIFRPLRHDQPGQTFDRADIAMVVEERGHVIHAAGVGEKLRIRAVLAHLLVHAVPVANYGLRIHDILAVHGQLDPQHAMRGGVLRTQVKDERFVMDGLCVCTHGAKSFLSG